MTEDSASDAHERQYALPRPAIVDGRPVEALGPQHIGEDVPPGGEMAKASSIRARDEIVPRAALAVE